MAKTKGGVYVPPNKPLVKLADLKAKHAGQTNWTELVVKDLENQADYNSAAPGTKFQPRLHPDTGALMVVVDGEIRFEIEAQPPIAATRGSIVNILRTTLYCYEVRGENPLSGWRSSPSTSRPSIPRKVRSRRQPALRSSKYHSAAPRLLTARPTFRTGTYLSQIGRPQELQGPSGPFIRESDLRLR